MNNLNKNENTEIVQEEQNLIPESILEIIKREEQEEIHALQKTKAALNNNKNKTVEEQESQKSYAQLEKEVEEGKKIKIGECV